MIGREAHTLKSAAGTFGYRGPESLALLLERAAPRLMTGESLDLLDRIDPAYAAASLSSNASARISGLASS